MADNVIFKTGDIEKNAPKKVKGQVLFSVNDAGKGEIYFDKDENTRIRMGGETADKLSHNVTIGFIGDVENASLTTDFSSAASNTIELKVKDDSHNHIISNVDGLQNALNLKTPLDGTGATGSWSINAATASKLQNPIHINGTEIKGNEGNTSITTNTWGATRTISIKDTAGTTGTEVNGSENEELIIPKTIKGFSSITSTKFVGSLDGKATSAGTADNATKATSADNATAAGKLSHNVTIGFSGDVTGTLTSDFSSSNTHTVEMTVQNYTHTHTIPEVTALEEALARKAPLTGEGTSGNWNINAATATKLQNPIYINGSKVEGNEGNTSITTSIWGAAKDITIYDNSKTNSETTTGVNGGEDIELKLPKTIKATLSGNASSATKATYATKLGTSSTALTNAGDENTPVYFKDGVPVAISGDIVLDVKTEHSITADKWASPVAFSISDVAGTSTGISVDGDEGTVTLQVPSTMAGFSSITSTNFIGSLDGKADKATKDADGNIISSTYLKTVNLPGNATTSAYGFMSATDKAKLDGVEANANKYTHPSYTNKASGLYKITVDNTGHVSATAAVSKSDITGLGIPAQDTVYTHPSHTAKSSGLYKITVDSLGHVNGTTTVSKSDITALGIPAQDTVYTHPSHTAKSSGLYKITVDSLGHVSGATAVSKSDITGLGIPAQDTVYAHPSHTAKSSGFYKVTVDSLGHVSGTAAVTKSDITALGIPGEDTKYTLPLAASGTRGGVQIGYSESGNNYAVKLSSEKMYVTVPWTDTNYYHTPSYTATPSTTSTGGSSNNVKIGTGTGVNDLYIPIATGSAPGATIVYAAAQCTTFSSDSGTVTPLAVQKGAKMFAITRPSNVTENAITRYSSTTGDVKDSKIIIEDVTNTKDSSKKAQVISIPAEGGKKMVYGYCTDQVDGTSFIGGVFDQSATSYPYASGLAIGGTSGNLLWKGKRVLDTSDLYTLPTAAKDVLGGVKTTSTVTSTSGLTACPIISGVPYYKDTNTTYTHPAGNAASKASGLYKFSTDSTSHITSVTAVTKDDITALGIPAQDTVYTLPTASSTLGGVKTTSTVTSTSGLTACPIISGVPYYKNSTYSQASLGQGYGTCTTAAATVAKVVTLASYSLATNGIVAVKFTNAVCANATMNINSKGAKAIFYKGAAIKNGIIEAGETATFVYDGTQYHLLTIDRSRFNTSLVPYGETITASSSATVDLNTPTYMRVGNYFCGSNANAEFVSNHPKKKTAFMMQVYSPLSKTVDNETGTWVYRLRKIMYYTGEEYTQYCYTNGTGGNWSYGEWKKVLTPSDFGHELVPDNGEMPVLFGTTYNYTYHSSDIYFNVAENALYAPLFKGKFLAENLSGTVDIKDGGTGATSASGALANLGALAAPTTLTNADTPLASATGFTIYTLLSSTTNTPKTQGLTGLANGVLFSYASSATYGTQFAVYAGTNKIYMRTKNNGTLGTWQTISAV